MTWAHGLTMSAWNSPLDQALAARGIRGLQRVVLEVLHYGIHVPSADLVRMVPSYAFRDAPQRPEVVAAVTQMVERGLIQRVTPAALAEMERHAKADDDADTRYVHWPPLGVVDFTIAGAECWLEAEAEACRRGGATGWVVHPYREPAGADGIISNDLDRLAQHASEALGLQTEAVRRAACPSGPWRELWWRRWPEGYSILMETPPGGSTRLL